MRTDRCESTCGQKCQQKEEERKLRYKKLRVGDTTGVVYEVCDCTGHNWSHRNCNTRFKKEFGSQTGKTFSTVTTKDSCTWNVTRNTGSAAVWSLKPERWGSPLVQEKYREEKACDRGGYDDDDDDNIMCICLLCVFVYLICICYTLCVFVVSYVYLLYLCVFVVLLCVFVVLMCICCALMCIFCTMCVLLFLL